MSLDHGVLNLPLAKRGDIDAQIDRYKAQQERRVRELAKSRALEMRQLRERAREVVSNLPEDRLTAFAAKLGVKTAAQARTKLNSEAYWNPSAILRVFAEATP